MSEVPFDDSDVEFMDCVCPFCGAHLSLPVTLAGESTDCPHCVQIIVVPADPAQPARKFPLPLSTKRLVIRRLRPQDSGDLYELLQSRQTLQYINFPTLEMAEINDWIARDAKALFFMGEVPLDLAIELAIEEQLIGWISMSYADPHPLPPGAPGHSGMKFELVIHRKLWKQGFGFEAVTAVKDFAFNQLALRRLTASIDNRNTAARGLLKKAGFREEGIAYQRAFINGEWVDIAYFAMLKAEFAG